MLLSLLKVQGNHQNALTLPGSTPATSLEELGIVSDKNWVIVILNGAPKVTHTLVREPGLNLSLWQTPMAHNKQHSALPVLSALDPGIGPAKKGSQVDTSPTLTTKPKAHAFFCLPQDNNGIFVV